MITPSLALEDEEPRIVAALPPRLRGALDSYLRALNDAPEPAKLAPSTRRNYESRVTGYLGWLAGTAHPAAALRDPRARNQAVAGYQQWLRDDQRRATSAINAVLTAIDDFYQHLGLGSAVVTRDLVTASSVPGLDGDALAAVDRELSTEGPAAAEAVRTRAVFDLMRYAGLAGAEVAALDLADVSLLTHDAHVQVDGRAHRQVPLHPELRAALRAWIKARENWSGGTGSPALFVNRFGRRLSARYCTMIVQQVGERAGISVSPAVLRATFAAALEGAGVEAAAVAALTGRRLSGREEHPDAAALRAAIRKLAASR